MDNHAYFLRKAIDLAVKNVFDGGGPFGAIITKDNVIIAEGVNRVTDSCDPTAHAEVMAIREACLKLQDFKLEDCVLYTSCEPCPMCLGAIYWSHIQSVYYAANREDAARIQFDDDFIYKELDLDPKARSIPFHYLSVEESLHPFTAWRNKEDRAHY